MRRLRRRECGSAMVEFAVVGPLLTLMGTTLLQYGLMFHAKSQVNHAAFMAAREGSVAHADMAAVQAAYVRALVPLYGGGRDARTLAESLAKAGVDVAGNIRIELLNPTKESFNDWADPALTQRYNGKRAINHAGLQWADDKVGGTSGQDRRDANLIKLRITHGYELKVPLANTVMQFVLRWYDDGADPFVSELYRRRRLPLITHVTLAMQSDAVEQSQTVSTPGQGNQGQAQDPGDPGGSDKESPRCLTVGCTVIYDPNPGGGTGGSGGGTSGGGGGGDDDLYSCPPGDPNCTLLCPGS